MVMARNRMNNEITKFVLAKGISETGKIMGRRTIKQRKGNLKKKSRKLIQGKRC
jgi:hypothetical protein